MVIYVYTHLPSQSLSHIYHFTSFSFLLSPGVIHILHLGPNDGVHYSKAFLVSSIESMLTEQVWPDPISLSLSLAGFVATLLMIPTSSCCLHWKSKRREKTQKMVIKTKERWGKIGGWLGLWAGWYTGYLLLAGWWMEDWLSSKLPVSSLVRSKSKAIRQCQCQAWVCLSLWQQEPGDDCCGEPGERWRASGRLEAS